MGRTYGRFVDQNFLNYMQKYDKETIEKKERLAEEVEEYKNLHSRVCGSIQDRINRLTEAPIRIVMCGGFSTGKTSLINALTGTDLPVSIRPRTRAITEVRFGIHERWFVETEKEGIRELPDGEEAKRLITENTGEIMKIICEVPSERLKRGVVFLDTPGLQDDVTGKLDEISRNALRTADLAILTFNPVKLMDRNESDLLMEMQESLQGNFVSVVNCMNYILSVEGYDEVKERITRFTADMGNDDVGYGRYFLTDSRKCSPDLNGLDVWLDELIFKKRVAFKCKAIRREIIGLISLLGEEGEGLEKNIEVFQSSLKEKNQENKQSIMERIQEIEEWIEIKMKEFSRKYRERIPNDVYDVYRRASVDYFKTRWKEELEDRCRKTAREMDKSIASVIYTGAIQNLEDRFVHTIQDHYKISAPRQIVYQRGWLDPDRYRLGKYNIVYNDYVGDALTIIRNRIMPLMDQEVENYKKDCRITIKDTREYLEKWNDDVLVNGYRTAYICLNQVKELNEKTEYILKVLRYYVDEWESRETQIAFLGTCRSGKSTEYQKGVDPSEDAITGVPDFERELMCEFWKGKEDLWKEEVKELQYLLNNISEL